MNFLIFCLIESWRRSKRRGRQCPGSLIETIVRQISLFHVSEFSYVLFLESVCVTDDCRVENKYHKLRLKFKLGTLAA